MSWEEDGKFDTEQVVVSEFDSTGKPVNPDRYDMNMTYSAGIMQTQWFTDGVNTWTKTYTYSGGDLVKISRWVRT